MKNKSLLDVMGNIEDVFVEEAAHPEILLKKKHKPHYFSVGKIGTFAACMVIAIGMVVAVPYIRVSKENAMDSESMNSAIQSAMDAANAAQKPNDVALASSIDANKKTQSQQENALFSSIDEENVSQDAAWNESQLPAEESKREGALTGSKELASQGAAVGSKLDSFSQTTQSATVTISDSAFSEFLQESSGLTFIWRDHVVYRLTVAENVRLIDLVIPETLAGEPIIGIADDFWTFCASQDELKTVTIPDTIETFGNVSALGKSVVIICPAESPAAEFFTQAGYSVQLTQ